MSFLWPWALTALLIVPLLLALYLWMLRRKQRYAVRYSSLLLVRAALPRHARWRRHLPFALFLTALAGLAVAMARPQAEIEIPLSQSTIMLAIDVSRSMCATDVAPNRLTIAQEAARAFVEDQPDGTRIGIVAFTGFAETVVAPTDDKEALVQAIDNFTTAFGTAIGSAILESIDAVALVNEAVAPSGVNLQAGVSAGEEAPAVTGAGYQPDIIVLLTDGANAQGPRPSTPPSRRLTDVCGSTPLVSEPSIPGSLSAPGSSWGATSLAAGLPGASRAVAVGGAATGAASSYWMRRPCAVWLI